MSEHDFAQLISEQAARKATRDLNLAENWVPGIAAAIKPRIEGLVKQIKCYVGTHDPPATYGTRLCRCEGCNTIRAAAGLEARDE